MGSFHPRAQIRYLNHFFLVGAQELGVVRFRAKVGMSNKPSIHLFRDKLKFKEVHVYGCEVVFVMLCRISWFLCDLECKSIHATKLPTIPDNFLFTSYY